MIKKPSSNTYDMPASRTKGTAAVAMGGRTSMIRNVPCGLDGKPKARVKKGKKGSR